MTNEFAYRRCCTLYNARNQLRMLEDLRSLGVPILLINRTFEGFDFVFTDTEASLREGLSWLRGKAGGQAALITFSLQQQRPYLAERIICIYELCMEYGPTLPPERIIKNDFSAPEQVSEALIAERLFRHQKQPISLILPNCELGSLCLNAAARCGKVCGKDFFMLSFDTFLHPAIEPGGAGHLLQNYTLFQPRIEEWLHQNISDSSAPYQAKVKANLRIC